MEYLPLDVLREIFLYLGDYSELSRSMSMSQFWLNHIKTIDFPDSFYKVCKEKSITIAELHERYVDKKPFTITMTGKCKTYTKNVGRQYDEYDYNFSIHVKTEMKFKTKTRIVEIDVHYIHVEVDIYDARMNQERSKHFIVQYYIENFLVQCREALRLDKKEPNKYFCDDDTTKFFIQRRMGGRVPK